MSRQCPGCRVSQPLDNFYADRHGPGGRKVYCRSCSKQKSMAWQRKNPRKMRQYHIKSKYGTEQDVTGPCQICHTEPATVIDHDHSTGKVRGFLCVNCNHGLGKFLGSDFILWRAREYVNMSRSDFLAGLPKDPDFVVCRDSVVPGYTLDPITNMWVCGQCRKPSGGNPRYSPVCLGCELRYTKNASNMSDELCHTCLGIENPR